MGENQSTNIREDMIYIGKVIKEKQNLFDMPLVDKSNDVYNEKDLKDTYGNIYKKSVYFVFGDREITFNAGKQYSNLKCIIAVAQNCKGGGILQIESEQGILYISKEILSTTEPYEIDIPINQASRITIKHIGNGRAGAMVADAVLYNEE